MARKNKKRTKTDFLNESIGNEEPILNLDTENTQSQSLEDVEDENRQEVVLEKIDPTSESKNAGDNGIEILKEERPKRTRFIVPTIGVLALFVILLFLVLPFLKIGNAKNLFENGEYEEAINSLNIIRDKEEALSIINKSEEEIAKRTAEYILKNDKELNKLELSFDKVYDYKNSLDYKGKSEVSSFVAEFRNDHFTYVGKYIANISKTNDGVWNVMNYTLSESSVVPTVKSDKESADASVLKEYPDAVFREMKEIDEDEVVYVYDMLSNERPMYRTGYRLSADFSYDIASNSWKLNDIKKEYVDAETIPLKKFITSIFTIDLPETWILTRNEDVYTWKDNSREHTGYNFTYSFYTDKSKKNIAMSISVYFSAENTDSINNGKNNINGLKIGKGVYSEYDKSIDASFWPKIRGMNSNFYIYGNGIEETELQQIVDSIRIEDHKYKLAVLVNGTINIRDHYSTKTGKVLSKAKLGNSFTAERAMFNEGYTWFNIAEGQWIADSDEEWLSVE